MYCLKLTGGSHPLAKIDGWHATRATRSYGGPVLCIRIQSERKQNIEVKMIDAFYLQMKDFASHAPWRAFRYIV